MRDTDEEINKTARDGEDDLDGILFEEMVEIHKKVGVFIKYELEPGRVISGAFTPKQKLPIAEILNKDTLREYRSLNRDERKKMDGKRKLKKRAGFLGRSGRVW